MSRVAAAQVAIPAESLAGNSSITDYSDGNLLAVPSTHQARVGQVSNLPGFGCGRQSGV